MNSYAVDTTLAQLQKRNWLQKCTEWWF